MEKCVQILQDLNRGAESLVLNDAVILEGLAQMLGILGQMEERNEERQRKYSELIRECGLTIESMGTRFRHRPLVRAQSPIDEFVNHNPEIGLLQYLYSFLSNSNAIDIGAHVGRISERLAESGYDVYAFEPYPPSFQELRTKLNGATNRHIFPIAVGLKDGEMCLHVASCVADANSKDLSMFNALVEYPIQREPQLKDDILVPVRSLESMVQTREIPKQVALLNIDTGGSNLKILRGMGSLQATVVIARFWNSACNFSKAGIDCLEALVVEMKKRRYPWHLVIYHQDESRVVSFYHNRRDSVPDSWGSVLFFREHGIFAEALRWTEEILPPTLFR